MFTRASKRNAKLRLAIYGPAGSGKTFSALRIATGLGSRIACIDTERGTASKYADRFTFDVCNLTDRTIAGYTAAIKSAAGYDVLIIDSLSHAWQELLAQVEKLTQGKFRGNSWSAWSEGTPQQRAFIDCLLNAPQHIIATIRSKTEWQTVTENGKAKPMRVGLAPEQGKGIEYEFDMLLELAANHCAEVVKDRTGRYQDQIIDKPGEQFGRELSAWLATDEPSPATAPTEAESQQDAASGRNVTSKPEVKRY